VRAPTLGGGFLDILPDLNQADPEVARYLIQNTLWWIGATGLDGVREDTLPYAPRGFRRDWMAAIKREYPNSRVVGEMWDSDPAAFNTGLKPAAVRCGVAAAGLADGTILEERLGTPAKLRVAGGMVELKLPPRSASVYTTD